MPIFYPFPVCQFMKLKCETNSEMLEIIKMILLTVFIIIVNLKKEGRGGNALNSSSCWTDNDAGPSPGFDAMGPRNNISVRNSPSAQGSLKGMNNTFFQKNLLSTWTKYKASGEMVKVTKVFAPRIWPAACPPKLMGWLMCIYIPCASHSICCYTFVGGFCLRAAGDNPLPLAFFSKDFFNCFLLFWCETQCWKNKPIYPD